MLPERIHFSPPNSLVTPCIPTLEKKLFQPRYACILNLLSQIILISTLMKQRSIYSQLTFLVRTVSFWEK